MPAYLPMLVTIILAIIGLVVAAYIHNKKQRKQTLVCPLHAHCDPVIHSDWAKFLGVPVELLGMAYYGLIAASYILLAVVPELKTVPVSFVLLIITTAAFLFSLYLTFIQAVAIKQWCSWCLFSASLCTVIFFVAVSTAPGGIVSLLAETKGVIVGIHLLGLVFGLGGATISDLLFFRFLKDFKIAPYEAEVMKIMSQIIWLGLAILIISGVGLYLPQAETLNASAKFLTKMIVVSIILVNGAFLNLVIAPRMITFTFGQDHLPRTSEMRRYRRLAFALGAVSFTSWYSAFVLGMLRSIPVTLPVALVVYVFIVFGAIGTSQLVERRLNQQAF
ncbi:MAG TPA: vitamin K epoxide reductase family protein [Candidatus Andersenbacteria bacterium]|nr:vitamin K epoxide reductase family protein [Candidatus Andersenbacteria bacterium]